MASKPVIFAVDDEEVVLKAIDIDLRKKYGATYRIMRAGSGAAALETLKQLRMRGDVVALFLSDQRMPHMTGVEFLAQAMALYPDAKKALLTAYADTDAAIKAINTVGIDHYLMKPWNPPEECLYPVIDDLLDDWQASYYPVFEGLRIVGHQWSPRTHQVKDFLARNQIPYRWLDIERNVEAARLINLMDIPQRQFPTVFFPDGSYLMEPTSQQIAEKVGLKTRAENPYYDLAIIGGGPAGLAAAVYGASEGLKTVLVEREAPGGQAGTSSRIENYLGFPVGLSGADLARRALSQARRFGVEVLTPQEAIGFEVKDMYRTVKLADGTEFNCKALMIATGVSYRKLDVPGMDQLTSAGVYYGAAMTEALSCADDDVFIVGGANSAGQAAMYFSKYARRVFMLMRGPSLSATMSQYLIDQIGQTPNIELRPFTEVTAVHGTDHLDSITLKQNQSKTTEMVEARALFIFIGAMPRTEWLAGSVERDDHGFILAGADLMRVGKRPKGWSLDRDPYLLETSIPGVFVAGDVRHRSVKRVASAVGEGSIAIQFIHQYLATL
jgi:thioredoxin reductase (NADPH)